MTRAAILALSLLSSFACTGGLELEKPESTGAREQPLAATESPAEEPEALTVWAHDSRLEATARAAAERIARASGLEVLVNVEGSLGTALPMFFSESGREGEWFGASMVPGSGALWVAISIDMVGAPDVGGHKRLEGVVEHELLHQLGAPHLPNGALGILSDPPQAYDLTTADLELLCSVASCTRFVPEVP
jgi:hypothetical protein